MSKKQSVRKESPKLVSIERRSDIKSPSERARIAAATAAQQQRDERARREALAIMEANEPQPAPHVRDDLAAARQRPVDAPMATRIDDQRQVKLASGRAAVTAASIVMVIGCIVIALWLGGELQ